MAISKPHDDGDDQFEVEPHTRAEPGDDVADGAEPELDPDAAPDDLPPDLAPDPDDDEGLDQAEHANAQGW